MKEKRLVAMLMAVMLLFALGAQAEEEVMTMELQGMMGERYAANLENWLLTAPYANPGMVQMYSRRNQPHQAIVPWYGEFSGKYLTSAAVVYQMKPDERLKQAGDYVVAQLAAAQDADGYLGVWPDAQKITGKTPEGHKTWDGWSHYHNMLGLRLWHQATGSELAQQVLDQTAAYLYDYFITQDHRMDEDKDGTDAALGHVFALLYEDTQDQRYLELVRKTFDTFEAIHGGNYYQSGLEGKPFYKMDRTRWECLHAIETIKEMYAITGEESYKTSFANIWDGIMRYDRHNTGGFSSGESACGNPYDTRAIETCCTIAWMALSMDMLDLSDRSTVADELELSTWNALLGAQQANGRSFTYNTPMLGDKKASAHDIVFQAIAGSSELNCCSVNGPRGLGMIGQWGVTVQDDCITVNYYGDCEASVKTAKGNVVKLIQTGSYPFGDSVSLRVEAEDSFAGQLRLRIPLWSLGTTVTRDGKAVDHVQAGSYLVVENVRNGEVIDLRFDMSLHCWTGNYELGGKTALYQGPILLAWDQRFNQGSIDALETMDLATLTLEPVACEDTLFPQPQLLLRASDAAGNSMILCDFACAGQTGCTYTTWIPTVSPLPILRESGDECLWNQRLTND